MEKKKQWKFRFNSFVTQKSICGAVDVWHWTSSKSYSVTKRANMKKCNWTIWKASTKPFPVQMWPITLQVSSSSQRDLSQMDVWNASHCLVWETLHLVPKGGLVLVKAVLSKCYYVRWRPGTGPGCLTGSTFFPLIALIRARARTRLLVSRADRLLRGSDRSYQCEHGSYPRQLMIPCWLDGRRQWKRTRPFGFIWGVFCSLKSRCFSFQLKEQIARGSYMITYMFKACFCKICISSWPFRY